MWPFRRKETTGPLPNLIERIERLEKHLKNIEVEWTDTYDKFRQLHLRVAKRVIRLEQAPEQESTQPDGGNGDTGAAFPLSGRQATIQERILARRNRIGAAK